MFYDFSTYRFAMNGGMLWTGPHKDSLAERRIPVLPQELRPVPDLFINDKIKTRTPIEFQQGRQ